MDTSSVTSNLRAKTPRESTASTVDPRQEQQQTDTTAAMRRKERSERRPQTHVPCTSFHLSGQKKNFRGSILKVIDELRVNIDILRFSCPNKHR